MRKATMGARRGGRMLTIADRLCYRWEEGRPMMSSLATMRAVRFSAPGPVDNLRLTTLSVPPERDGWVRIRVKAFGLNLGAPGPLGSCSM